MLEILNPFEKYILSGRPTTVTDWGNIFKGEHIDKLFSVVSKKITEKYGLDDLTHSLAIAQMKPFALHRPYIRFVDEEPDACRVYKVISGTLEFIEDGHIVTLTATDGEKVVHNGQPFSSRALEEGCVFQIHDFPAFEVGFDENSLIIH